MKKLFVLFLSAVLMLTLTACSLVLGGNTDPISPEKVPTKEQAQNKATAPAEQTNDEPITRDRAIDIALAHAGFDKTQVIELETEFDREPILTKWEIDFKQGKYEYSYDINAQTGEIIKFDKELD